MPDDPKDWDREDAQLYFEEFVVVLLRALANGEGSLQLPQLFFRFLEHARQSKVRLSPVLDGAVKNLHARAFSAEHADCYEVEQKHVTEAALRVIAESMAADNAARARRSQRQDSLKRAIEDQMLAYERRTRKHGRSHLKDLADRVGK